MQLQPVLIEMLASSSLVMFLVLSGPGMMVLKATFIRLLICLQVKRGRLLHCLPGDRHTISVIVSEAYSILVKQFLAPSRSSRSHNLRPFGPNLSSQSQVSLRSVSGQSQVSLRSVSGQSQVSHRSVTGLP